MTRARRLRLVADDLRKKAREPGDLAYRARLVILADEYELLAFDVDSGDGDKPVNLESFG